MTTEPLNAISPTRVSAPDTSARALRLDRGVLPKVADKLPAQQANVLTSTTMEDESPKVLDAKALREMVEQANQAMKAKQTNLMFSVYEETGTPMIQVFDRETDKLIRQYPPEEYLGVAREIQRMMDVESIGIIFTEQA